MLCPFSPFHCPPAAQAKSQMPSQQWENMSFQGASAIVPNMAGRAHCETEWERQGLCSPVDGGRLHNSTSGLSLGRGYVRSPHLGFKLTPPTRDIVLRLTADGGEDMNPRNKC